MDRWDDRDERADTLEDRRRGPMGNVARHGLNGFVKSGQGIGTAAGVAVGKVEVVASKREQKQREAAKVMPPPPALPSASKGQEAPAQSSGFPPPSWAGPPLAGVALEGFKDGVVVVEYPLTKAATVFGRGVTADAVLDHASISRQHAAVCYQPETGKFMVMDLGSAHGTFVDGKPLTKGRPVELAKGVSLRFGASTRVYRVRARQSVAGSDDRKRSAEGASASGRESKRGRVRFSDDDGSELAKIIGYSDGSGFAVGVGPTPATSEVSGRFANLVQPVVVSGDSMELTSGEKQVGKPSPKIQPKLKEIVEVLKKKPLTGNLYDSLPPKQST